jgi:hypothetical protein
VREPGLNGQITNLLNRNVPWVRIPLRPPNKAQFMNTLSNISYMAQSDNQTIIWLFAALKKNTRIDFTGLNVKSKIVLHLLEQPLNINFLKIKFNIYPSLLPPTDVIKNNPYDLRISASLNETINDFNKLGYINTTISENKSHRIIYLNDDRVEAFEKSAKKLKNSAKNKQLQFFDILEKNKFSSFYYNLLMKLTEVSHLFRDPETKEKLLIHEQNLLDFLTNDDISCSKSVLMKINRKILLDHIDKRSFDNPNFMLGSFLRNSIVLEKLKSKK